MLNKDNGENAEERLEDEMEAVKEQFARVSESSDSKQAPGDQTKPGKSDDTNATVASSYSFQPPTGAMAIRQAFEGLYGNANPTQVFSLVWPGTKFDYSRFSWDAADPSNPNPVYPPVTDIVTSQLLDQWYPPALITQPDGTSTADRYKQAIGQLAPQTNPSLAELQQQVRDALQQEIYYQPRGKIDNAIPDGRWITLMDLFDQLNGDWISAKKHWGKIQYEKMDELGLVGTKKGDTKYMDAWNTYVEWYELVANGYIADINEKYDNILVYFPLNEWNDCLAILDTTDAPYLEQAKQEMRELETAIPHQFGIEYYPTTGQPYNFGNYLIPTTSFVDLLADPQFIGASLSNSIQGFQDQIASLQQSCTFLNENLKGKIAKDNKAYNDALSAQRAAQVAMQNAYVDSTITAAKAVIAYETGGFSMGGDDAPEEISTFSIFAKKNKQMSAAERKLLLTHLGDAAAQNWETTTDAQQALITTMWTVKKGDLLSTATKVASPTPDDIADAEGRVGSNCSAFNSPAGDVFFATHGSTPPDASTVSTSYSTSSGQSTWLAVASGNTPTEKSATALEFPSTGKSLDYFQLSMGPKSIPTYTPVSVSPAELTDIEGEPGGGGGANPDALNKLVDDVGKDMKAINQGQQSMLAAGVNLATTAATLAKDSNDEQVQQIILPMASRVEEAASALQKQLAEFSASSAKQQDSSSSSTFPVGLTTPDPSDPTKSIPCDVWDAVQTTVSTSMMKSESNQSASSSNSSWGLNLFLASGGGEKHSAASNYMSNAANANSEIQIGMLCMKINIERPWMHPEIFDMSSELMRTGGIVTNIGKLDGASIEQLTTIDLFGDPTVDGTFPESASAATPGSTPPGDPNLFDNTLPSYPVSLLIAKDVTIKVTTNAGATAVARSSQSQVESSSGGFLCFSSSSSSSSQSSSSSASSFCSANTQVFRSPAPQVIGVWSQLTPPDRSTALDGTSIQNVVRSLAYIAEAQDNNRKQRIKDGLPVLGS
ncbi:Uncharacterised protein [Halioglobus japonicus]|nr:Uncharacterised protein [Halioglobus japonicus]